MLGCFQFCCPGVLLRSPPSPVLALPVELAKPLELELLPLTCFCGDPTVMGPRSRGTSAETILIPMPKYSCTFLKRASNLLPTYCAWTGIWVCESCLLPGKSVDSGTDLPSGEAAFPHPRCMESFIAAEAMQPRSSSAPVTPARSALPLTK